MVMLLMLQEMQENLEVTRDVWGMQLDAARNRIIRIELLVAVASLALMAVTVPGALFGMNIPHVSCITPSNSSAPLRYAAPLRGMGKLMVQPLGPSATQCYFMCAFAQCLQPNRV